MKLKLLIGLVVIVAMAGCLTERKAAPAAAKSAETNYIGTYLGMIAEHDGKGGVIMFSATSGQCLKMIPYKDFNEIFVLKTKPEYP